MTRGGLVMLAAVLTVSGPCCPRAGRQLVQAVGNCKAIHLVASARLCRPPLPGLAVGGWSALVVLVVGTSAEVPLDGA